MNDIAIIAAKYKLGEIFYEKTVWIARTAVCLALLIAIQFLTKSLGQLVTGSCVNLVLAIAALIGGVWSGVTVAAISPFCAYLLGIGPAFLPLVPCVSLGNAVYAVLFALLVGGFLQKRSCPPHMAAWCWLPQQSLRRCISSLSGWWPRLSSRQRSSAPSQRLLPGRSFLQP